MNKVSCSASMLRSGLRAMQKVPAGLWVHEFMHRERVTDSDMSFVKHVTSLPCLGASCGPSD